METYDPEDFAGLPFRLLPEEEKKILRPLRRFSGVSVKTQIKEKYNFG